MALLLFYGAYRLLRAATVGRGPQPVREAGFATLVAVVGLVQALKAKAPATVPEPDDEFYRQVRETLDAVAAGTYHQRHGDEGAAGPPAHADR